MNALITELDTALEEAELTLCWFQMFCFTETLTKTGSPMTPSHHAVVSETIWRNRLIDMLGKLGVHREPLYTVV